MKKLYKTTKWKWYQLKVVGTAALLVGAFGGIQLQEYLEDWKWVILAGGVLAYIYVAYKYFKQ